MSESPATWSAAAEHWLENVGDIIDIVAGVLAAAIIIWVIVRIINDPPNLKTKGLAFWLAAGMLAVGALSVAALSAIFWLWQG